MTSTIFSGVRDPQKAYNWKVIFYGPGGTIEPFYAKNTSVPMRSVDTLKRFYAGAKYSFAGQDTSPSVFTLTLWDREGIPNYLFFQEWFNLVQGGDRVPPSEYMKDAEIQLLGRDDSPKAKVVLTDVWPTEIGEAILTYADSAEFTFDVRFFWREMGAETMGGGSQMQGLQNMIGMAMA